MGTHHRIGAMWNDVTIDRLDAVSGGAQWPQIEVSGRGGTPSEVQARAMYEAHQYLQANPEVEGVRMNSPEGSSNFVSDSANREQAAEAQRGGMFDNLREANPGARSFAPGEGGSDPQSGFGQGPQQQEGNAGAFMSEQGNGGFATSEVGASAEQSEANGNGGAFDGNGSGSGGGGPGAEVREDSGDPGAEVREDGGEM